MTEETYGPYEGTRHYPTGSLWISEPSFARDNTAEDWAIAAEFLRDFHLCAVRVNDALMNAVADASQRCWAEHERASERENTPDTDKDRFGLSPGEAERLRGLLHRSDALNNAHAVVDNPSPNPRVQEEMEVELRAAAEEARMEVDRYKRELGVPEHGRPE